MQDEALARFLATGDHDPFRYGASQEGLSRAHDELIDGLIAEVKRRARGRRSPRVPKGFDPVSFSRAKLEPMVRGLFPRAEQDVVLAMLETSVVFVTRRNIERLLREESFLSSARTLANLYLGMVGAELLSEDSPRLVGFSEHMTCYVSPLYFREDDPFADFIVHEAAHVFHNCKRRTIGLPHTRRREWLLDIEFGKRETFAYCCEAFSRIAESTTKRVERVAMASRLGARHWPPDERVDPSEFADILEAACGARNGWKVILRRCAPVRVPRARYEPPNAVTAVILPSNLGDLCHTVTMLAESMSTVCWIGA